MSDQHNAAVLPPGAPTGYPRSMGAYNANTPGQRAATGTHKVPIKGVWPDLHKRLRVAAAEEGLSYAKLLDLLLDERDARQRRRRAQQAHPLQRLPPEQLDPQPVSM